MTKNELTGIMDQSSGAQKMAEAQPRRGRKFSPVIDMMACKGCLLCVYSCDKLGAGVLGETGERTEMGGVLPTVEGECTGCRWCERFCPDFAISVVEVAEC